jgi:ferredoxin-NADP reductase
MRLKIIKVNFQLDVTDLKAGDQLEVMPPQGIFFQKVAKTGGKTT